MHLPELARLDATAQAELVRRREVAPDELVRACLDRIDRLNPLVHAAVTVVSEPERAATDAGPFAGVPFLVKDVLPWPGLRWSMGARVFARNVAPMHTPFGAKLAASGLVCVGKSATSEVGLLGSTETLLEGVTHNPWDPSFSAAGSSGGAAAAVAAGLVPIAHASDGGGSIRIPASVCGLFGFKPSRGRHVPAALVSNDFIELTSDHCVTRSVRDSALFLSVTEDPAHGRAVGFVKEPIRRRLRIGTWTRTASGEEPTPAVRRAYDESVALLRELGHEVVPITAPALDGPALGEAFFVVAAAAVAGLVAMVDARRGSPVQRDELEPFSWSLVDHLAALGETALPRAKETLNAAGRAYREATRGFEVVLTPTLATEPWRIGHLSPLLSRETLMDRMGRAVGYTPLQNIVGCAAMSVPLVFPDDGPPIGTHFAAAPGDDAVLLELAYELERARPWASRWPRWSIPSLA